MSVFFFFFFLFFLRVSGRWLSVLRFCSISLFRHAMSTLLKLMAYGLKGLLLLSMRQRLCLGRSVGDLVDGWPLPISRKKSITL